MNVSIITIGDEILIGQIVDTNSAWLAQRLNELGLVVHKIYSIQDSDSAIKRTLDRTRELSDIVLITGGLGPTNDDITKKTLCSYFEDRLERNPEVLAHIEALFKQFGIHQINELNRRQADLPSKCKVLNNPVGTASGMWFEEDGKHFIALPGVPHEMKAIMETVVLPDFKERFVQGVFLHKTVLTLGIPESILADLINSWEIQLPEEVKLAYLPSTNRVRLRLSVKGDNRESLNEILDKEIAKLYDLIPDHIYGEEKDRLEECVGALLRQSNNTVATAESCTGGYLAHLITSVSGSSDYFKGSVLSYANEVKINLLGVSEHDLEKYGAVSEPVIRQMAVGARDLLKSDYALATSGVAGPTGGTEDKPVGTVWMAIAHADGVESFKYIFGKERMTNIKRSATTLLLDFLQHLKARDKKIK